MQRSGQSCCRNVCHSVFAPVIVITSISHLNIEALFFIVIVATETAQQLKKTAGVPFHAKGRGLVKKIDTTSELKTNARYLLSHLTAHIVILGLQLLVVSRDISFVVHLKLFKLELAGILVRTENRNCI